MKTFKLVNYIRGKDVTKADISFHSFDIEEVGR